MSRGGAYLDASALTKLFRPEPESDRLERFLAGYGFRISSRIVRVEVQRALLRLGANLATAAEARRALAALELRELTDDLLASAERLEPIELRALDAIHLATALELAPSLAAFVCYDRRLAAAAAFHGLSVVAPGADEIHES